jgi:hypothetical protein
MHAFSILKAIRRAAWAAGMAAVFASAPSSGQEALENTPFSYGDGLPDLIATCETIRDWASKSPQTKARIDLAVRGKLSRVSGDGALVYLIMCEEPNPKIMCVTYRTNGMSAGDVVRFGGGFRQLSPEQIVLDPCLASRD